MIEERIADVCFVLDQLEILENSQESIFYKRLDKEHIGIFGQSLGGSTAITTRRRDKRIKAAVDMDGSLFGKDATIPFDKPIMFLIAGETLKLFEPSNIKILKKALNFKTDKEEEMLKDRYVDGFKKLTFGKKDDHIFVINGAGHLDLVTNGLIVKYYVPYLSRQLIKITLIGPMGLGTIDGKQVIKIVNDYLLDFFDKYLQGKPSLLLDTDNKKHSEINKIQ